MAKEKKEKSQSAPQASPRLATVRNVYYRLVYANSHRIRLTGSETSVTFGVLTDAIEDSYSAPVAAVQEEVSVLMPYGHIKLLAIELTTLIEAFEKVHGEIPLSEAGVANAKNVANVVYNVFGQPKQNKDRMAG